MGISAQSSVPTGIVLAAQDAVAPYLETFLWTADPGLDLDIATISVGEGSPIAEWIYAVAVPFATLYDDTTVDEVMVGWRTGQSSLGRLVIDQQTAVTISSIWGPPVTSVEIIPKDDLVASLWSDRPSYTIIPFHELVAELKVLRVDGLSPLDRAFEPQSYPLTLSIGVSGDQRTISQFLDLWNGPETNRDPLRITRIAMSGVTALGRATAYQMEIRGITTPGDSVRPVFEDADIAHVSHEVSFSADCPYPNPIGDPIFCARDGYLDLIRSIGADVIELSGNHVNDWGPENMSRSVDLYEQAGMQTFGGGRDLGHASEPALFEHNGNKIAFVGCNPVGPPNAWATEFRAGSLACDYPAFYKQIGDLKDAGYLVIATQQYGEFYHYAPTAQQQIDFRALVEAGASVVSGSQGHHAQGFDIIDQAFIHYGLGNLFFDQMDMLGTRQSFIDTYTVYEGRLINVELTTSLIENYCCPREMNEVERVQLLDAVFRASGW
jgi:poly-gamma-glutamate synthesis protein (capsule biosynthesis protein)